MVAGAAAGVAAIFKAPATGCVFALEVPYQDDFARKMLLPALVASASGYLAFVAVHGTAAPDPGRAAPPLSAADLVGRIVLGLAAGPRRRACSPRCCAERRPSKAARGSGSAVAASGALLALIAWTGDLLAHEPVAIGVGYSTIAWALEPRSGGVAAPRGPAAALPRDRRDRRPAAGSADSSSRSSSTGALLGRAAGALVPGLDNHLALVVGVAAVLGAGYRVPLAAIVFVAEATGRPGFIVPALLAAVAADLVMGRRSVTAYQRASAPADPTFPGLDSPA